MALDETSFYNINGFLIRSEVQRTLQKVRTAEDK